MEETVDGEHRAAKNDRAASAGPKRYSSVSRARYVECRLARVGVCELAIMREMSKRFYPKNVHQPWPLALKYVVVKGRKVPHRPTSLK